MSPKNCIRLWSVRFGVGAAIAGAGALGAVGSVAGGVIQSGAAKSAANTQAQAADLATALQVDEFQQGEANLAPFVQGGQGALAQLRSLTGTNNGGNPLTAPLTAPSQPTMAQLAATPGYQFTLQQGEQATQNSFAAQGLGNSGAALKGAANYAEGLASTTYQQQFQNYLTQNQQIYSMLGGQSSLGENAAATSGNQGIQGSANAGSTLQSGAAASAAGTVGSANAVSNAIGGVTGAGTNTALALALNQGGLFGNTAAGGVGNNIANQTQSAADLGEF